MKIVWKSVKPIGYIPREVGLAIHTTAVISGRGQGRIGIFLIPVFRTSLTVKIGGTVRVVEMSRISRITRHGWRHTLILLVTRWWKHVTIETHGGVVRFLPHFVGPRPLPEVHLAHSGLGLVVVIKVWEIFARIIRTIILRRLHGDKNLRKLPVLFSDRTEYLWIFPVKPDGWFFFLPGYIQICEAMGILTDDLPLWPVN